VNRLGLTHADWVVLCDTIVKPYRKQTRVYLTDINGNSQREVTHRLLDGQVDVNSQTTQSGPGTVTRSAQVTLLDVNRTLPFDTDSPAAVAVFLDSQLRIEQRIYVPSLSTGADWVTVPVFFGPVTRLDRTGYQVTIEAGGREMLYQGSSARAMTFGKGMKRTDVIQTLLNEGNGEGGYSETLRDIPDLSNTLPKPVSMTQEAKPWDEILRQAAALNRQVFYDGSGTIRLRPFHSQPVFAFQGKTHVVNPVQVGVKGDQVANCVIVIGGVPKGKKTHVQYTSIAPADHPLSPQRIGRRLLPSGSIMRNDRLRTVAECKAVADQKLAVGLQEGWAVAFESVPVPFLDPLDYVRVQTSDADLIFQLQQFSLPLVTDGDPGPTMSVGYNANRHVRPIKRQFRL
jgi:hypothetical protein